MYKIVLILARCYDMYHGRVPSTVSLTWLMNDKYNMNGDVDTIWYILQQSAKTELGLLALLDERI